MNSKSLTESINVNNKSLFISDLIPFNGTIDEVRIYNRALTPEEIYQHYIGWLANRTVNYPDGTTRVHKIVELNDFKEITGAAVQALSYNLSDTDWNGQLEYDQRELRISYESSDMEAPTYSNVGINETEPVAPNTFVKHYAYWQDSGEGLDYYIFSWTGNSSVGCGTWVNDSAVSFGGASAGWSNVTKSSTCTPSISWRIYAKDMVGNWNDTGIQTYSTNVVPSVVLISPENNTNTTDNTPTFVYNISDSDSGQTLTSIVYVQNATGIYAVGSNTTTSPASNLQISKESNLTLVDGTYTWWVNVSDGYNTNKSEVRTLTIDTTSPVIEYGSGTIADNANISQSWIFVNVSITESHFKNVTFYLYNSSGLVNETTYNSLLGDNTRNVNWTGLSDGSYWFNVTTYDWAGSSDSVQTRNVGIDTVNPGVEFDSSTPINHANISVNYADINVSTTDGASGFIDWNRSLVGYWRFQEGSGIYANDTSTYGNNGTLHGFDCTTLDCNSSSGWTSGGKFGRGLVFDGVDDYVEVPDSSSFDLSTFTIEAWVYLPVDQSNIKYGQWIIDKMSGTYTGYYIRLISTHWIVTIGNGTSQNQMWVASSTTAGWHHIVYSFDNVTKNQSFYIDGVLLRNRTLNITPVYSAIDLIFGTLSGSSGGNFSGKLDEVRIWNRALTPEEINASYHNGLYRLENNYTSLSDGNYEYYAYVTDEAGNVNRTPSTGFRSLTVDTVNPSLSYNFGTTQNGNLSQDYIFVNVSFSDASPSSGLKNLTYYLWNSTGLVDSVSYSSEGGFSGWCYQESANASTSCGGLDTGSYGYNGSWINLTYAYDGNWSTYAQANESYINIYFNYSKPSNAVGAIIQTKTGVYIGGVDHRLYCRNSTGWVLMRTFSDSEIETVNTTINDSCFEMDPIQLRYYYDTGFHYYRGRLYEEAMWWNISNSGDVLQSPNSTNFTGLADGEYWFNVTTYDWAGNGNNSATRNVVLDTINPTVSNPTANATYLKPTEFIST